MNIILLGPPGSGKGTQAEMLVQNYRFQQLSTGDLFRKNILEKTALGLEASKLINSGNLVPDEITNKMVEQYLLENKFDNLIFDGYPRTINQAEVLNQILDQKNLKIDKVIFFKLNQDLLMERLTGRLVCPLCKRSYHIKNRKPKIEMICDFDSGPLVVRPDDHPDQIAIRLKAYEVETAPLVDYYNNQNKLVSINCEGKNAEELFLNLTTALELS
ncbi:adenylate kinase [Spiroplasma sabaudiense Ar-1343]|uniref:Adenylate kinase n=1 Tax=Spiroplasma sabaudiense Ar-1343 TaxID=1276257 RepID=W6AK85_9MOLU|nr:adenylate kinase [Spiroplasma sabaudiense]AHI54139.1 adenylate kinase [Spiroplasma sabaudiense Ar-1343]